jgi:predicted phage terminase large subunit-like protein
LLREIELHPVQKAFCDSQARYRGFVGGRGSGKSWAGAYDLIMRARPGRLYYALAPTYTMLKDASLRTFLEIGQRLQYIADVNWSSLRIVLGNGAEVLFRSADEPERLRGPNLTGAWLDEASVMSEDVYTIVIAALREKGEAGWLSATFTPKGRQHWTYRVFGQGRDVALFHCSTRENPFVPREFVEAVSRQYTSRLREQELEGKFIDVVEGALWKAEWIEAARVQEHPQLVRVVVAIDPAGTHTDISDETGIVVAGLGEDGDYYVLHAAGYRLSPAGWAKRAVDLYHQFAADRIIAERNQGGEMVEHTIRSVWPEAPVSTIVATRGKAVRAEPVAALYEQGRVHHVSFFAALEEQMCAFPVATERDDIVDALVYAISELSSSGPGMIALEVVQHRIWPAEPQPPW